MTTPYIPTSKPRNYTYSTLLEARNNNKKYAPGSKIFIEETQTTITHKGRFASTLSKGDWSQSTKEIIRCRTGDKTVFNQNIIGITPFTTNIDFNQDEVDLVLTIADNSTSRPWQKVFIDMDQVKIVQDTGETITQGFVLTFDNDHARFVITDRDTGTFTLAEIGRDLKLISAEATIPKEVFVEERFQV